VEYKDILPSYTRYCNIKKKHSMGEVTEDLVVNAMQSLCKEIEEFLVTLYAATESSTEREILKDKIVNFISNH
jgi:predicted metal-dependent hydrolase